jgi:carotenoid cleavage dioxygenase
MHEPTASTPSRLDDPYLRGLFAPVTDECTIEDLPIAGTLPADLEGIYVRNGSNPRFRPEGHYHWFDGDGMLHAVHFEGGRATYRNRYVRTSGLAEDAAAGRALRTGILERPRFKAKDGRPFKDTANTDVIYHAGQLLALWYLSGHPYVITLPACETLGVQTYGGALPRSMASHAKVDHRTGELLFIDYAPAPPYLAFGVVSPAGELIHHEPVDLERYFLQHDLAFTPRHTLLFQMSMRSHPKAGLGAMKLAFDRDRPARIGVVPRFGTNADLRWFDVEPFYMYHTINAWEDDGAIVLYGCRLANPITGDPGASCRSDTADVGGLNVEGVLYRWRLDLTTGSVAEGPVDDTITEFPRMNDRWIGGPSRYSYHPRVSPGTLFRFDALLKYELTTGSARVHRYARGWFGGEPAFTHRDGATAEDEGYVTTFVTEEATGATELLVIDARDFEAPPVARVRIPRRVPAGFHCRWVSAGELARQRPL